MLLQQTQDIKQHLSRAIGSAGISASSSAGLNWQGFEQLQQAAQEDQQQQQQHSLTVEEVMANLQKVAAGSAEPAPELTQRIQQQEVAVMDPQLAAELDSSSSDAAAATAVGTEETAVPAANTAAGAASTAIGQAATAAPGRSRASAPGGSSGAATAEEAAGAPDPAADPEVQLLMTVEMPGEEFSTPSGKKYSSAILNKRTAETLSPGGMH